MVRADLMNMEFPDEQIQPDSQGEQMYQELLQQAEHIKQLKAMCSKFAEALISCESTMLRYHEDDRTASQCLDSVMSRVGQVIDDACAFSASYVEPEVEA